MSQQNFSREQFKYSVGKFNDIVNDLFSAQFQSWGDQFTHFMTHCEQDSVMRAVTEPLRSNRNVDAKKWYEEGMASQGSFVGTGRYKLPYDDDDKTALLYQFFLMLENNQVNFENFCLAMYGHGNYQAMVDTFNQELVEKFTREVFYRLDRVMVEMGYRQEISREAVTVIFNHHHNNSMHVQGNITGSNIAANNSTISNSSATVLTAEDISKSIQSLREFLPQVEEQKRPVVEMAISTLTSSAEGVDVPRGELAEAIKEVSQVPVMREHLENLVVGASGSFVTMALFEGLKFILGR